MKNNIKKIFSLIVAILVLIQPLSVSQALGEDVIADTVDMLTTAEEHITTSALLQADTMSLNRSAFYQATPVLKGGATRSSQKSINLVSDSNPTGSIALFDTDIEDVLYFGNYNSAYPVPWYMISQDQSEKSAFMLSKYSLGLSMFRPRGDRGYYENAPSGVANGDSELKKVIDALCNDSQKTIFTDIEREAVKGKYMRPLSRSELGDINNKKDIRPAYLIDRTNIAERYWLYDNSGYDDAYQSYDQYVNMFRKFGVRPVFKLDLSSAVFTSSADVGGKVSGALGSLAEPSDYYGGQWKLTIKDTAKYPSFTAQLTSSSSDVGQGEEIKLSYSGASDSSDKEYVSVILTDNLNSEILYYGHIAQQSASCTDVSLYIPPDIATGDYKLGVFAEQINGDKQTDYASDIKYIDIKVITTIAGEKSSTVEEGYRAFTTSAYSVPNKPDIDIDAVIDQGAGDKISYNKNDKTITVEQGLTAGVYRVTLTATIGTDTLSAVYTLTVNQKQTGKERIQLITDNNPTGSIIISKGGKASDVLYLGNYSGAYPVPWYMLKREISNGENTAWMLSKYTLGQSKFRDDAGYYGEDTNGDTNNESILKKTMDAMYDSEDKSLFTDGEKNAIAQSILSKESMYRLVQNPITAYLYPLSVNEVSMIGGDSIMIRSTQYVDYIENFWWLRSSDSYNRAVSSRGGGNIAVLDDNFGVRPAMNLKLNSILFTSMADAGKLSDGLGSDALKTVEKIEDTSVREWKATLKDDGSAESIGDGHKDFAIGITSADGESVTLGYKGAVVGDREYISALIIDVANKSIKYYGNIAKADVSDGKLTINLNDKIDANDELYVFIEQLNGDKATDYAGSLIKVPYTDGSENAYDITNNLINITGDNKRTYRLFTDTDDYNLNLKADEGYTLPDTILVKIGEDELEPKDYSYDKDTGAISISADKIIGNIDIKASANKLYKVEVTGGSGSGSYTSGQKVSIKADYKSGYTFAKWSSDEVKFLDERKSETTFEMIEKNVNVRADYTQDSSDDEDNNNNNTGGVGTSSSSKPSTSPNTNANVITNPNANNTANTNINSNAISNTNAENLTQVVASEKFEDVKNHWAKEHIQYIINKGILTGTGNKTFSPDMKMTRGMFVTALGRLAEINQDNYTQIKFTDLKQDAYYTAYANWAVEKGIVNGTSEETFSPDSNITREQMAVIMKNYADKMGYKLMQTKEEIQFADEEKISVWAKKSIQEMQKAGILSGKNNNNFDPNGELTRAEVATIIHRFAEIFIDSHTATVY